MAQAAVVMKAAKKAHGEPMARARYWAQRRKDKIGRGSAEAVAVFKFIGFMLQRIRAMWEWDIYPKDRGRNEALRMGA